MTGTHFYTINEVEKDHVIATWPTIYAFEGVAWFASKVAGEGWVPIYRFFNKNTGTHFYTPNEAEKETVVSTLPQFQLEGTGYFVRVPSTAPSPMQMTVEKAVVKPGVITGAEAFLTRINTGNNFTSPAGRNWVVGQVFLHNGSVYQVTGLLANADGSMEISTRAQPLIEAYDSLKFQLKMNALVYDQNHNPLSAELLAAEQVNIRKSAKSNAVTRKAASNINAGVACIVPKQVLRGSLTLRDSEWGYEWRVNCNLNELFGFDVPVDVTVAGTLAVTGEVEHIFDQEKSTNYTITNQTGKYRLTVKGAMSSAMRNRVALAKEYCKVVGGALSCEKIVPISAPFTTVVAEIPLTTQLGVGIKFTVDVNGNISFAGSSTIFSEVGILNGFSIDRMSEVGKNSSILEPNFAAEVKIDVFGFGALDLGVGAEVANQEAYLVKLETKAGLFGNANISVDPKVCADYQAGVRAEVKTKFLKFRETDIFNFNQKIDFPVFLNGSSPNGCSSKGAVRLGYTIAGKEYYLPNYIAYPEDTSIDVYDASLDLLAASSDGKIRIDFTDTIGLKGKSSIFEIHLMDATTSTANLDQVVGSPQSPGGLWAKAYINPGNTTYGDVIRFRISAYDPSNRAETESTRLVELRFEPPLTANPEYWTVIGTGGNEQYFVRYNYAGATASMIRSGYLALNGANSFNFSAPGFGDVQSFKEIRIYNEDQRIYMRPTRLALLGKHDRDGNEKLFNVVERTDVLVGTIGISPANPRVGQLVTFTVNGERLPAALAVTVPNCTGLQELRSSGNIAKNNHATGERVYECTASVPGTNLIARVGPENKPFVFSIGSTTGSSSIELPATDFVRGQNVALSANGYGADTLMNATPYGPALNAAEWDFSVPTSGVYELFSTFASSDARPQQILFNGVSAFPSALGNVTGGLFPADRRTYSEGTVYLAAGSNVMRVVGGGFVFPHVSHFSLSLLSSSLSGVISVPAILENGVALDVPAGASECTFNAAGTWNTTVPYTTGPSGWGPIVSWPGYSSWSWKLLSAPMMSLLARDSSGQYVYIGDGATLTVAGDSSISFVANDAIGGHYDNGGSLSVVYGCRR